MSHPNPYDVQKAEILDVIEESPQIKTFQLKLEKPLEFETGQFVELSVPGVGEAPFTPSSSHYQKEEIEVSIMKTGFVTEKIHEAQKGDIFGIRGPYGKGYPLDKFKDRDILLLGGGVGLAPLRCLLQTLIHDIDDYKSITVCFGAKTPQDMIYKDQVDDWKSYDKIHHLCTVDKCKPEDNWQGCTGVVTVLLDDIEIDPKDAVAIVCGPPIMMKFGTFSLLDKGFKEENIYLSMEKKMYCGFGECRHCVMGGYYACKDGPVFSYDKIKDVEKIWE
ncbi:MAG: FAD/NAD(P)-binding protein [Candidatus Cloacimonetes bacterium]|nr:FAD/NAD(P)-binding protein [Candidatus Cloacimonadota bacterium]MBS3767221.1 FAD/NAD(P)-binding protein [Candidatus Cloacimonadota bacterium]